LFATNPDKEEIVLSLEKKSYKPTPAPYRGGKGILLPTPPRRGEESAEPSLIEIPCDLSGRGGGGEEEKISSG